MTFGPPAPRTRQRDRYNAGVTQAARYGARHKHSIIHVHTKLTEIERGKCPLGEGGNS